VLRLVIDVCECLCVQSTGPVKASSETRGQAKVPNELLMYEKYTIKYLYHLSWLFTAALQEQNTYAVGVWRRVKDKLDGRDFGSSYRLNVSDQVNKNEPVIDFKR